LTVLAAFLLTLVTPGVFAQGTHVSNPYVGATVYASPDYVTGVRAAATANPFWASQSTLPLVWMDHIGAIYGGAANNNRLSLQGHINAAVKQANDQQFMEWSRIPERRQYDGERTGRPDVQNIPANGSYSGFGFNGNWNGTTNAIPTNFALNGTACTITNDW
jgi:hypothetical protein